MSFIDACSFMYNGISSDNYGLRICWMDDAPDLSQNGLIRTINSSNVNRVRLTSNVYDVTYEANISFTFYIIKKDKTDITKDESITINDWLSAPTAPRPLYFNDATVPSVFYYAICTSIEDIVVNRHKGKKITFETNSPFGFMHRNEKKYAVQGEQDIVFNNLDNTENMFYYPVIRIDGSSDVTVMNMTDGKSLQINLSGHNSVTVDCARMRIMDNNTQKLVPLYSLGITDDNLYWFRLAKGGNRIKITGNCTIVFVFEFPRKVGCL